MTCRSQTFGRGAVPTRWGLLGVALLGCAGASASSEETVTPAAGENPIERYFGGVELQIETDDQRAALEAALADMETLPVEELRVRKYPDYQLQPDVWDLPTLLERYYVPDHPQSIHDGFWEHVGDPASRAVAARLRSALRSGRAP